jgi:hypothetical protein
MPHGIMPDSARQEGSETTYGLINSWLVCVIQFFILMAILYGVSDVAEDLWLARLFLRRGNVAKYEGVIACALTDTKIVTISLSVIGVALFELLGKVYGSKRTP